MDSQAGAMKALPIPGAETRLLPLIASPQFPFFEQARIFSGSRRTQAASPAHQLAATRSTSDGLENDPD